MSKRSLEAKSKAPLIRAGLLLMGIFKPNLTYLSVTHQHLLVLSTLIKQPTMLIHLSPVNQ